MSRALELAASGRETTAPNPNVGAVVVQGDEVVGEGWHEAPGKPHAEPLALDQAGERARGATLYVTLEPCCHTGRTGPCTERILAAGIARVVVGLVDPDPRVQGQGVERLRQAGVEVELAPLEWRRRCAELNLPFLKARRTGLPLFTLKYAATLDGRIAAHTGHSQWISGPEARQWVHEQRSLSQAVMVGIGTVLADDPRLDARCDPPARRQPWRVVVDTHARTPAHGKLFTTAAGPVVIAVGEGAQTAALEDAGAEILRLPLRGGRVDLAALARALGERDVQSVLVEGGGGLNWGLLEAGLVDRVAAFVAPRLLGGRTAPGPVGGRGVDTVDQGWELEQVVSSQVGKDLLIEGYLSCPWLTY